MTDEQKQKYREAQKILIQILIFVIIITLIVSWCLKNERYERISLF